MSIADYLAIVEHSLDRKFRLKPLSEAVVSLPEVTLSSLKEELSKVKHRLNNQDIRFWHMHTGATNPSGLIVRRLRDTIKGELITQAWAKCYEILSMFPALIKENGQLTTLHLCEAPGAFIFAFNHYLSVERPGLEWKWRANSLNPYYEGNNPASTICDDRLIFPTLPNWMFGKNNTGSILDPGFLEEVIEEKKHLGHGFDLVSGDGSFPCHDDPDNQERLTFPLHFSELVIALHALNPGGALILKKFTHFEPESLHFLRLIYDHFNEVSIVKPSTSKSGNSEQYVVANGFTGLSSENSLKLRSIFASEDMASRTIEIFGDNLDQKEFLKSAISAAEYFASQQKAMIEFNLDCFNDVFKFSTHMQQTRKRSRNGNRLRSVIRKSRQRVLGDYLDKCKISSGVTDADPLLRGFKESNAVWSKELVFCKAEGTFSERIEEPSDDPQAYMERKRNELVQWYGRQIPQTEWAVEGLSLQLKFEALLGKGVEHIVNSKFCNLGMLSMYLEIMEKLNKPSLLNAMELAGASDYGGFNWDDKEEQLVISSQKGKRDWIQVLKRIFSVNNPPKEIVIQAQPANICLTRLSSNILALLCLKFKRLELKVKDTSGEGRKEDTAMASTIIAREPRETPKEVEMFLDSLFEDTAGEPKQKKIHLADEPEILQLLPMNSMNDPSLYSAINGFNNSILSAMCLEALILYKNREIDPQIL